VKREVSERRQNVISALQDRSPRLASIYRTALGTLDTEAEDGCESARVSVICHCMRELMTGLPAVMADTTSPRPDPSSGGLTKQLPRLLAAHPGADLGADQDLVPVPKEVAHALKRLIDTAALEDGRNRLNAAALVTGGEDSKHPAVNQWLDVYEFFVGWAHLDRNHKADRQLPSDVELAANIRVVEDVIEVRTAVFFENLKSLEGLLGQINARVEEDV
jgi:hypothetical protein